MVWCEIACFYTPFRFLISFFCEHFDGKWHFRAFSALVSGFHVADGDGL